MRQSQFPLSTQFYADASRDWTVQDVVNYIPEIAETGGTASPVRLRTAPGLREEFIAGDTPIRGIHNAEGAFFVVQANTLFQYVGGVLKALGQIPGAGPVQITHNQFQTGNQVLVENGQPGGGYIWDTNSQTFSNITDPGYPGSISTDYLDQYMIQVEPLGRFWYHSNLADASDYNTLDRYESEASPDKIVAIKAINGDVMVLNQTTIEFFRNTGAATGTFQRIQGAIINEGCAGGRSVVRMDNSVLWLGSDGVIYRLSGYTAQPISTRALERAIADLNWSNAIGFTLEQESHKIYYLHFPDGPTFGYDVTTQLWHRRSSMTSAGADTGRWRLSDIVPWNNKWMAADIYTGKVWSVDWDYFLEGQTEYTSRMVSPVNIDDRNAFIIDALELLIDTGEIGAPVVAPTPLPPAPQNPPLPTITGTPPAGRVGDVYSFGFTVGSGTPPLVVSLLSGSLPPGVSLNTAGVLSGTPTTSGSYGSVVQVTDAAGRFATLSVLLAVNPFVGTVFAAYPIATNAPSLLRSSDATTWSTSTYVLADALGTSNPRLGFYGGGRLFFFAESSTIQKVSVDDGANWTNITAGASGNPVSSMCYTGQAWIIVGQGSGNYGNWRSTNGTTFSSFSLSGVTAQNGCVARGGTVLICRRATGMGYSSDHGANWSTYTLPATYSAEYVVDTGTYFIVATQTTTTTLYRSLTGASGSWSAVTLPASIVPRALGYGNGRVVIVSQTGASYYSLDNGFSWATGGTAGAMVSANTDPASKLIYSQGQFVLAGDSGCIYTSPDSITWTTRLNTGTGTVKSVTNKVYP